MELKYSNPYQGDFNRNNRRNEAYENMRPEKTRPVTFEGIGEDFNYNVSFSNRELQIIELICHEYSYKEIGIALSISHRTVESHKATILNKMGAKKATGIVAYAAKRGWLK